MLGMLAQELGGPKTKKKAKTKVKKKPVKNSLFD